MRLLRTFIAALLVLGLVVGPAFWRTGRVALATTPAKFLRGTLGTNAALAVSTQYEFVDLKAPADAQAVVFYFRTTRGGTLRIDRLSAEVTPAAQRLIQDIVITEPPPADELVIVVDGAPLGTYRVYFTNGAVGAAAVSLEGSWIGGRSTGYL